MLRQYVICVSALTLAIVLWPAQAARACVEPDTVTITVDQGHSWRPPFGVDRVGALPVVQVKVPANAPPQVQYGVVTYRNGTVIERKSLEFAPEGAWGSALETQASKFGIVRLASIPDEVEVMLRCTSESPTKTLHRHRVPWPRFEADARVLPERQINPVDLGAILVPQDWLLLKGGQSAILEVAAITREEPMPHARLRAWFEGQQPVVTTLALAPDQRSSRQMRVPLTPSGETSTLHVEIVNENRELWRKSFRTMVVTKPPQLPAFGLVETKLRYDAPIAVGHVKEGRSRPSLDYRSAWDPKLKDVVIALPNGSRFVFWRGASYIPFWAGLYNTGLTYQWAEGLYLRAPTAEGGLEMPEALNDKELRYSSIRVLESTASHIHVRWTYQATDLAYRTFGDQVVEDYHFYPDEFGTRTVTLIAAPHARYELSEFITLMPQGAFPWAVLPEKVVEMLYLDGEHQSFTLPIDTRGNYSELTHLKDAPALYKAFQDRRDPVPAIYFSPTSPPPRIAFGPFYDRGERVTPTYWGDHWPLSREKLTRYYIHEGIRSGPGHSSFIGWSKPDGSGGWAEGNPDPIDTANVVSIDALGKARPMRERRWAWLIGKSSASEEDLRAWAHSFSTPPSLRVRGARLDAPAYAQERRAIRLVVDSPSIEIELKPATHTMNPVFELADAPRRLHRVRLGSRPIPPTDYAWDGKTLWIKAWIDAHGAVLSLHFHSPS